MVFVSGMLASEAFAAIRNNVPSYKAVTQNAVGVLTNNSANTDFIFGILDGLNSIITNLNTWKSVNGLDAYATAQGYPNSISTDCASIVNAAQACVNWVVSNFPVSGGFLLGYSLVSDGSRTSRNFTPVQTQGLQSALNALIATIG